MVIFLIFLAVISGIYGLYNLGFQPISWDVKFDSLGSFLAGTSGTILAFASVIFIYSGLLKQQQQLLRQRSDIEKRLLFYYFLAYPEKMESFREWYLHSELISRDLAEPHLLQMMDKKRFPPFDMDSYKLTVD